MTHHDHLKKAFSRRNLLIATLIILLALIIISALYTSARLAELKRSNTVLNEKINVIASNLSISQEGLAATLAEKSTALEKQIGTYKKEVGKISGTVETLEKLSKTDPELLQKYSKVFFLNEHYAPPRLAEIPNEFKYTESKILKIHADVHPYLEDMLEDALDDDVTIYISSAFRSFNEQTALKDQYTVVYGAGSANSFSADQGYSEHQLGTTVDLTTKGINGGLEGFDKTPAYAWLTENAHKYGFILSYPKDNGYYVYEPWHWRFVGVDLATDLHEDGKYFYDLDQRAIDDYLVDIFE